MLPSSLPSSFPQIAADQSRLKAISQLKNGASWFFWIAGLSLVNSAIILSGSDWNFLVGLGATQVIDVLARVLRGQSSSTIGSIITIIAVGLDLGLAGLFGLFGWLARKGSSWPFIVGMILYALDGLIFVFVKSWPSVGFHVFALFGLYGGLKAISALRTLAPSAPAAEPVIYQQISS